MLKPKKRWKIHDIDEEEVSRISSQYNIHKIVTRLLLVRGIKEEKEITKFLNIDKFNFHDPFLLDGMEKAVNRIHTAILKNEKILIYGDYDADGVTSTTILYKTLKKLGANFAYYIPNRFTEGYGLNKDALIQAANKDFKLVITVDTGISAVEEAELAKDLGICLIITDHHEPQEQLPDAFSIINPKKPNDNYPFKYLAGVGVAFKLAHALLGEIPEDLLDIVSIGTIADLVPLMDENRIITSLGLQKMNETKNLGLRTLLGRTGLLKKEITAGHVGFVLGPRVNASGRLDTATNAVKLFVTEDQEEANALVDLLEEINKERQEQVDKITEEADSLIINNNMENDKVIVLANYGWNIGVIGIVASRILEKYYRPTIILSIDPETNIAKGSARSVEGFDIFQALTSSKELLLHFGGHPAAAGLSINSDNISNLRENLISLANEVLTDDDLIPIEKVDAICHLNDVDLQLISEIERMAPFGIGNPNPRILVKEAEVAEIISLGNEKQHLKLSLRNESKQVEAMFFRKAELLKDISRYSTVELLGELSINEWNGQIKPQLIVRDMQIFQLQVFDWRNTKWQDKLNEIELDDTLFIVDDNYQIPAKDNSEISSITYKNWNNINSLSEKNLVLVNLPASLNKLKEIIKKSPHLERIYCIFEYEGRKNLTPYLNREYYKQVYLLIKQNESLQNRAKAEQYFSNLGISSEIFHFILSVFEELGFIILDGEKIILNSTAKKDLQESNLYNSYLLQEEINNICLNSSHQMLRKWFIEQH